MNYKYISIALLIILIIVSYNYWKSEQTKYNSGAKNQNVTRYASDVIDSISSELSNGQSTRTINL